MSVVGASARCGANFALAKREGNGGPSGCCCRIRAKSQSCGPQNRLQRWRVDEVQKNNKKSPGSLKS